MKAGLISMDDINAIAEAACEKDPDTCVDTTAMDAAAEENMQVDDNQGKFKLAFYVMAVLTGVCLILVSTVALQCVPYFQSPARGRALLL